MKRASKIALIQDICPSYGTSGDKWLSHVTTSHFVVILFNDITLIRFVI